MEVEQEVMIRGRLGEPVIKLDHLLVIAIHEIDLDAFNAPFLKTGERVPLAINGQPDTPENEADIALSAIGNQFVEINDLLQRAQILGV